MIDIEIIKKKRSSGSSGTGSATAGSLVGVATSGGNASHAATADEADHAARADNATHADSAKELDGNSTVWQKLRDTVDGLADDFLSKTGDDTAQGVITFAAGLIAKAVADLQMGARFGDDAFISELGDAVLNTVRSIDYDNTSEQGFSIEKGSGGKYGAFLTNLTVWGKAVFHELEIRKLSYAGGNIYLSGAGSKIVRVVPVKKVTTTETTTTETTDGATTTTTTETVTWEECNVEDADCAGWKCYLLADDGTTATMNYWQEGDQARCQTIGEIAASGTYADASNRSYWRTIPDNGVSTDNEVIHGTKTETYTDADGNELTRQTQVELYDGQKFAWIVLGKHSLAFDGTEEGDESTMELQDPPKAGDTIVLDGNRHRGDDGAYDKTDRQNVIVMETTGDYAPRMACYANVTEYKHTVTKDGSEVSLAVFETSPKGGTKINSSMFEWTSDDGSTVNIINYRGDWSSSATYHKNDQVSHGNAMWVCIANSGVDVTEEPTSTSTVWKKVMEGGKGEKGDDAVTYYLEAKPGYIKLNADGSIDESNGYTDGDIPASNGQYMTFRGCKVVGGKRYHNWGTQDNPISVVFSINGGTAWYESTNGGDNASDECVYTDFQPSAFWSYGSIVEEIGMNGLKKATAIMYEGMGIDPDKIPSSKILATLDIPIVQDGASGTSYGVSLALEQRTISSVTDDCLVVRFTKTGSDGVTTTENIADFEGYAQLLVDGKASEAATTRLNLGNSDAGTLSKSAFPDLFAASYITVKWFDYQGGTLLATASLTRGADGDAAETYEMMVSEYSEYTSGGRVYGLQFQFAKVTGATRQTVTDITQIGCHVAINTSRYVYTSAAAYVNEGHDHLLFSSYPVNSVTMDEADNITVKMYLDTDTDNENPVAAVNYANGKQGTSALEIMVNPETLVFDTEDTGLVASGTTKSATISCYRDGVDVTSGCTLTLMTGTSYMVNCSASLSGNTLTINSVTSQTVTVDGTSQTVSQTSGYATVQVYDPTSRLNHFVQVPFTVNIAKFTGGLKADNKKLQSQYSELTNDGSIKDLTQYKSEILQTARQISLHVSEKNVGRRNLLVGSALRKQGEGVQIAIVKDGDGIQMVGGYEGTNCLRIRVAGTGQYPGLFWSGANGKGGVGYGNIKIESGKQYTFSMWVKRLSSAASGYEISVQFFLANDEQDGTRPYGGQFFPHLTKSQGEWELIQDTVTIPSDTQASYVEVAAVLAISTASSADVLFCRPMLEEGSEYLGWTLSERDYDYIGGNLLDNTATFAKGGNLSSVNETAVTQNGMGESAVIHKAMRALAGRVSTKTSLPTSASYGDLYACTDTWLLWQYTGTTLTDNGHYNGFTLVDIGEEMLHNDFLTFSLSDLDDNGDYIVSWYAKGNAQVGCYVAGSSDHKVTIECSDGYTWNGVSAIYGEHAMQLANNWTRYWVHVRKTAGTVTGLYFRQYRNEDNTASEAYFSQPKLEVGATMTEWTEKRSDMVDKQALLATGIDIDSKKITLTANTTVFQDNDGNETAVIDTEGLRASKIATTDTGSGHTVISGNSTIWFQKDGVTPGIAVFYDAAGVPHFQFYGSDGAVKYDFGPSGLQSFISSTQQAYSDTAYLRAVSSKVSESGSTLSFAWVYVKSKQSGDLRYIYRKQIPTTDASSASEIYDGCVFTGKEYKGTNWPASDLNVSGYLLADGWYVEPNDGQLPMKLHMAEEEAVYDPTKTVYYQTFYYYSSGKVSRMVKAYMMRDTNASALADKFYYTGEYEEV